MQFFQGFPQTLLDGSDLQVSAEQPPEKPEPQEPVRELQAGVWFGGGGRLEQRGQEDFIQGSEEEEDLGGEAWGSLAWNMELPPSRGLSEPLDPLLPSGI